MLYEYIQIVVGYFNVSVNDLDTVINRSIYLNFINT